MTLYIGNEGGTASHFDPSLIGMGFFMSISEKEPKKAYPTQRITQELKRDMIDKVELYDTTLRDGTQQQGISLSVED